LPSAEKKEESSQQSSANARSDSPKRGPPQQSIESIVPNSVKCRLNCCVQLLGIDLVAK